MKNRNEMIFGWIKEVNEAITATLKLKDALQRNNRSTWLEKLKKDLIYLKDGVR